MSALSGIAGKGDKSKSKFKTIDINNVYKGTSVGPQKTAGKPVCILVTKFYPVQYCAVDLSQESGLEIFNWLFDGH